MCRATGTLILLLGLSLPLAAGEVPAAPVPRTLVLCVDGISYSMVEGMYRRGELPHFQPPSALVPAFPSLTNPALVEMLAPVGAPPSRGYEDYYFDPQANRMRGGFFHRFTRQHFIEGTFRELFDYHPHPAVMTAEYALPVLGSWLGSHITLSRIFDEFERSSAPVYVAYLDATDSLVHLSGERLARGLLKRVDRYVARLERKTGGAVNVIVFSDHGNDVRRHRRAPLERTLERAGFQLDARLRTPRSVVFPRYGLVGSAVLYTQPGAEADVAVAVAAAEGVALAAHREGDAVVVRNASGQARLRQGREGYCYEPERGDPLELEEVRARLRAAGQLESGSCARDADWWAETAEHAYPDALRRLWAAFEGPVAQPASVIVSLKDGYYTGSQLLDLFAFLRATHGSLSRAQSLAFVLTTTEILPPTIRGHQLWDTLAGSPDVPRPTRRWPAGLQLSDPPGEFELTRR